MSPYRIQMTDKEFQRYTDDTTKWQRRALLLWIALSAAGYPAEAERIMKLSKEEAGEELARRQNEAGVISDEAGGG